MENRFKGDCKFCGEFVGAGEGFYDGGWLFCSDPIYFSAEGGNDKFPYGASCLKQYNLVTGEFWESARARSLYLQGQNDIALAIIWEEERLALATGGLETLVKEANVRSLEAVVIKVFGSALALNEMTFEEIVLVRNELDKKIWAKKLKGVRDEWKRVNKCPRCEGAGQSENWAFSGRTCYRCLGSGKY